MKSNCIIFISMLLMINIPYGCNQAKASKKGISLENQENLKDIIAAKNKKIESWYLTGSIDSLATSFAENVIQMPPNHEPMEGIKAFKDTWRQNVQFGQWEFDLTTREVKSSGDLAVELGKYTLNFTSNDTSPFPSFYDYGNYVALWEKIDGDWKIVWDAPVSEKPMGTPPPVEKKN